MVGFLFGAGTGETASSLKRKRELIEELQNQIMGNTPKTTAEGIAALMKGAVTGIGKYQADKVEGEKTGAASSIYNKIMGDYSSKFPAPEAAGQVSATSPAPAVASGTAPDMSGNEIYSTFMDTVKQGGVENPFALAAIASTGKAESGFSPKNANRTWNDPSQSGQPGTAGGIMSWRGPRYNALAATGDMSPAGQAKFFLQEDPQLIAALNKAGSVEEAQQLMNKAWAFAGYDQPGGEAARRLQTAQSLLPNFQGAQQPVQVASLDPSAGMATNAGESAPQPMNIPMPVAADRTQLTPTQPQQELPLQPLPEQPVQQVAQQQPVQQQAQAQPAQMPQPIQPAGIDPRILQALSDPFLPEEQRSALQILAKQQMEASQNQQAQQTWQQRQAYEQQQQMSDPLYQQKVRAGQMEIDSYQTPQQQEDAWRARQDYEQKLRMSDPSNQLDSEYKRAQIEALRAKAAQGEGADEWGLNPVWGKDKNGNTVLGQASKSGKFKPLDTGDFTPTPGINNIDTGTAIITRNSKTGETMSATPKENFKEAYDSAAGGAKAKSDAETKAEYDSITSKMPGLYSVVDRLTTLADKASYTMAGKTLDWGINQLGLDPREEAVARAEYTATVDNQILPLLRDTFGAQFTNEEGIRLAKTLGDADKSPTEKQALLKAFIQQKERDIRALSGRVGQQKDAAPQQQQRRRYNPQTGNLE